MIDEGFGYKVFHFGVSDEYRGRWLTAHRAPGFHVWLDLESAYRYLEGLQSGEVVKVRFCNGNPIQEPDGAAVTAQELYIPEVASTS